MTGAGLTKVDDTTPMDFRMPPVLTTANGALRKVGYEIEFGGLTSGEACDLLREEFGGSIGRRNRYYMKITGSRPGDFVVKIDSRFLYEKQYSKIAGLFGIEEGRLSDQEGLLGKTEQILEGVFSSVVPYEIVTPPVEITRMHQVDRIRQLLKEKRALGTSAFPLYSFAIHINPELPSMDLETLLNYLRAFLILYPWLDKTMDPDNFRRLTAFIKPFPRAYIRKVLDEDYRPGLQQFISDYNLHNPDRNRPLDLYPVLAMLDAEVEKISGIGNVKKRPTFHFRMPDSRIDEDGWTLATVWNAWFFVEMLASRQDELTGLRRRYLEKERQTFAGFSRQWAEIMTEWCEGIPS